MTQVRLVLPSLNAEVALEPSFRNAATKIGSQLRRIDHVEIPGLMKCEAGSFYAIHIFFKASMSNIPTMARNAKANTQKSSHRTPDALIYQRFSDFSALRYDLQYEAFSPIKQCQCTECMRMVSVFQRGLTIPHIHLKWFRGANRVCKDLESFLNAVIHAAAPYGPSCRSSCESTEQTQSRLHQFLFDNVGAEAVVKSSRDRQRKPSSERAPM